MKQNKFFRYLGAKVRFSIRSVRTSTEIWHTNIRRISLILNSIALFILMFGGVFLFVIYTPILDITPGYPGSRSREILLSKIEKLDSLQREVLKWEKYTSQLQMILEGRIVQDTSALGQSSIKDKLKRMTTPRSISDSILRDLIAESTRSGRNNEESKSRAIPNIEFTSPIKGEIISIFDPSASQFGVRLTPKPNTVVQATKEGTIISSSWDAANGYTVLIQHSGQIISKYSNLDRVLYDVGTRVSAGSGIGVSQSISQDFTPTFGFELWVSGNPVDPEAFMIF